MVLGFNMAFAGEIPEDVLTIVLGSRKVAADEAWRLKTAKRDREVLGELPLD